MIGLLLLAWLEAIPVTLDAGRTETACRVVVQVVMGCEGHWPPRRCEHSAWWVCSAGQAPRWWGGRP